MKKLVLSLAATCCILAPSLAQAVTYRQLEAVNSNGSSAYSGITGSITLTGVVLNDPTEMSTSSDYWQLFIQSLDPTDHGGVVLWDGYMNYLGDGSYGVDASLTSLTLNYGDVVTVTAYATDDRCGKCNLTDNHGASTIFTVTKTTDHYDTVSSETITLADLKNTDDTFQFDSSRNSGCEYYQSTLVSLKGLTLADASLWGKDQTVTVKQKINGVDYTFDLLLGSNDSLNLSADTLSLMETKGFDLTAILDQEDTSSPYTGGYRLWLTSTENGALTVVPEPGALALCLAGGLATMLVWRRRRSAA
ncbi:MAG: PEP-CTERM sorting domain-containing protein [Thermoguttaceae bacterium]